LSSVIIPENVTRCKYGTGNATHSGMNSTACSDASSRLGFMIPSASGSPANARGKPAPKRVTTEFFKDLLAGGIAGDASSMILLYSCLVALG